jgi:hypothetical protein
MTSFFSNWITFISFSYLIVLGKTVTTLLNSSSETGYSSLDLDLRGKAFSLLPLSMMLRLFSLMPYWLSVSFSHEGVLNFFKCFFYIICHGHVRLFSGFVLFIYVLMYFFY